MRCPPKRITFTLIAFVAAGVLASGQTGQFTLVASIPGPADLVQVHGNRAYVVGHGTLRIFDVTSLAAPRELGAYTFPEKVWGIEVMEPLIYVAADFFGLGILDITNPAAPRLRGSLKTPGQAKSVAVVGGKAAVADHMSGVDFIDTSNADKPAMLGSFYLEGYAREVAAFGSLTYAVDAPTGVYTFDMTQPGAPEPVHAQQTATAPGMIVVSDHKASTPGRAVLVGAGTIQVYDLTKPTVPARLGALKTPSGRATRAALHGSHAFVADFREGLQVVDLSDPKALRVVASYKTTAPARDVAVAGSHAFVVVGAPSETPREFKDQEVLILRHPY